MATNEHNSSSEPILTSISGSTLALSADIDQAVLDIQNYIDTTKNNIDLSITNLGTDLGSALSGSQVDIENAISQAVIDIQSHVSGSTISIDNFIDAAVTNINANVDSKTSLITTINNSILGSGDTILGLPNLNVGTNYSERRCTSSGTSVTLFNFVAPGYLWVQAYNDSPDTIAEVKIYRDNTASEDNLISKTYIQPQSSAICACFPALCDEECFIVAKADGTNPVCVMTQLYTTVPGTEYPLNVSDNVTLVKTTPDTIVYQHQYAAVRRYTTSDVKRSIIKFDLSSIDPSAIIDSVFLELTRQLSSGSTDFHLAIVDEDCVLSEATWNSRSSGVPWSVAGDGGGSLSPTPIWSGSVSGPVGTAITFDVTEQVKAWLNGSVNNNGFILYYYPGTGIDMGFYSYFYYNSDKRPRLIFNIL